MARDLTIRQRRFAEAWVGEAKGNGTEAARICGYSGDDDSLAATASRTLGNVKVKAYIDALLEGTESAAVADIAEIHEFLTSVMRGKKCRQPILTMAGPVMDDLGNIKTKAPTATDRVKAATELAKMRGHYAPEKQEVEHKGVQVVRIVLPDNGRGPKPE